MVNTKVNLDQFERAGVYLFLGRFLCPALSTIVKNEREPLHGTRRLVR